MAKTENPAALDKTAPQTEARNAARQAEVDKANKQQPETVLPEPRARIKNDKEAIDAILEYLDGFGTTPDAALMQVRRYAEEGRSKK